MINDSLALSWKYVIDFWMTKLSKLNSIKLKIIYKLLELTWEMKNK